MSKSVPVSRQAQAYLLNAVRTARDNGTYRLRTLTEMSAQSGIGRATLARVLNKLKSQNIVNAWPGRGITVPRESSECGHTLPPPVRAWERVRDEVLRDVQTGHFPREEPLPSVKELTGRYASSRQVLRTALWSLVEAGVLAKRRRGYGVAGPARSSSTATIVLIAVTRTTSLLARQTCRSADFWRAVEHECRRRGTSLTLVSYHSAVGEVRWPYFPYANLLVHERRHNVLGYLVLSFGFEPGWMQTLVGMLAQTGKPVSCMDDAGVVSLHDGSRFVGRDPRFMFVPVGTTPLAGEAAGRNLIRMGHRKVVCIAPVPSANWCRNRTQGLIDSYRRAGLHDAVTVLTPPAPTRPPEQEPAYQRVSQAFEKLQEHLHQPQDRISPPRDLLSMLTAEYARESLGVVYAQALQVDNATAWVGMNDDSILPAMLYLYSREVAIPGNVSLVGIDDTVDASAAGLTSYNFNMAGVARTMFDHILTWSPSRRRRARRTEIAEVPGMLMERNTSGPPFSG